MAEEKSLFRKKSLDRIKSPEHLNDYIRVATPGTWITIIIIALILLGVLVWACFGQVASNKTTVVTNDEDGFFCYISEDDIDEINTGLKVYVEDKVLSIKRIEDEPGLAIDEMGQYALHLSKFEPGDWVYAVELEGDLDVGTYPASIKIYTASPVKFLYDE